MNTAERFWLFVEIGVSGNCWNWKGAVDGRGYGQLRWMNRTARSHRISYELTHGPIPRGAGHHGAVVMHSCDNKLCCNPAHLVLGDHVANMADMKAKGRRKNIGTGSTNGRCKLTLRQVESIRADMRGKRTIAKEYGISPAQAQRIRRGDQWRPV